MAGPGSSQPPGDGSQEEAIPFTPIGHVEGVFRDYAPSEEMRRHYSRIVLRPELAPGLMGLAPGQHILVLFHFHRAQGYELQLHPRHDPAQPLRGVFATRSQYRPNGIGATVALIVGVEGNVVTVTGLDAQDGSPVLDIKPYAEGFDAPAEPGAG
jgi:tRNA-Thr(GGU) m(6)t(6)A37 methyltransferase TsaA